MKVDTTKVSKRKDVYELRDPWTRSQAYVKNMPHGKSVPVSKILYDWYKSPQYATISPRTRRSYQSTLKVIELIVLVGNKTLFQMNVEKVTYATVDYMHALLLRSLSPGYIKIMFSILSNVWENALRTGHAAINPWLRNKVKVDNQRDITWTSEQIESMITGAEQYGFHMLAVFILLMYETGQRPWQDIRNLKWTNYVSLEDGRKALDFTISKTNTRITLPLSQRAIDCIESFAKTGEYIFTDDKGQRMSQSSMNTAFLKVKERVGIPSNLLMRDIRRTVVTEMAMSGATRDQIRAVTGWKSDCVVTRYARSRVGTATEGLDRLWELRKTFKNAAVGDTVVSNNTSIEVGDDMDVYTVVPVDPVYNKQLDLFEGV